VRRTSELQFKEDRPVGRSRKRWFIPILENIKRKEQARN
jgi:hypothetical protein